VTSHRTLASVALLTLRTWFHIKVHLILLIHLWMSLPRTFLRAPRYLHFLLNYPMQQKTDSILDDQIISTKDERTRRYLIKLKERLDLENYWITEEDFRQLDLDLLERYQSQQLPTTHPTGLSSSHPGRIDEDIMPLRGRFDRVYCRKRRNATLWL